MTEVTVKLQAKLQQSPVTLTIAESVVRVETEDGTVELCALDFRRMVKSHIRGELFDFLHKADSKAPAENPKTHGRKIPYEGEVCGK